MADLGHPQHRRQAARLDGATGLVDRGRKFLRDRHHLVGVLAPIQEALEACRDEGFDQGGILLDQVVVDHDAVADDVDAAVGVPEHAGLLVAADFHRRNLPLGEAGNRRDLARYQRRRGAGRIDADDPDLAGVDTAALREGRPLLELGRPWGERDAFSFQVLRGLDVGIGEHDHRGRIAPVDAGDGPDAHALGDAVADHEAVRIAELGRLAGDQLGGAARALAGPDVDVEAGLGIEALVLRHHETGIRPLEHPIEAQRDVAQLGLRARRAPERDREKSGAGAAEKLASG